MRYLINNSTDPWFNMAFDEYWLKQCPEGENIFYLWRNRPAVIIGLNQNVYSEVNLDYLSKNNITLARRVTGGGAVYHDLQNLNYSIIGKGVTTEPIVNALKALGAKVEVSGRNDLFIEGKKFSGYARRVWHDKEIVHGTMMFDVNLETLVNALSTPGSKMEAKGIASVRSRVGNLKDYLPDIQNIEELKDRLTDILAEEDSPIEISPEIIDEINTIAKEKFATWEWIYGHSHRADIQKVSKLPCGTVETTMAVDRGILQELSFGGDFIGDLPADDLAKLLIGRRFSPDEIDSVLSNINVEEYFSNTSKQEIIDLIFKDNNKK